MGKRNSKLVLDLGGGINAMPDATHLLDMKKIETGKKMIIHDLNKLPLPFPDEHFDKIYANNIIEHIGIELYSFIKECHRVLRDGGSLIIKMPNFHFILKRLAFLFLGRLPSYAPQHIQFISPSLLKKVLVHHGFGVRGFSSDLFAHFISYEAVKYPVEYSREANEITGFWGRMMTRLRRRMV